MDTSTGVITTFAGTGSSGYSGDGGPAVSAKLRKPRGIFADGAGNIYIADTDNDCIRKIDAATETITRVAGYWNGSHDFSEATVGTFRLSTLKLDKPRGVAASMHAGNIYIADTETMHVIRKVDVSTNGIIDTVAGAIGTARTRYAADTGDGGTGN